MSFAGQAHRGLYRKVPAYTEAEAAARSDFGRDLIKDGVAYSHDPDWFNNDASFQSAVSSALKVKRQVAARRIQKSSRPPPLCSTS